MMACPLWSDEVAAPAALDTTHEVTLKAESENPASSTRRRVFARRAGDSRILLQIEFFILLQSNPCRI